MFMTNICIALWFSFSSAYDNLALNKPAHEEYPYVHPDTSASNAVDGLKSDLTALGGQCSASANNQRTSTWWVNLTSIRSIHDIRIYYRTGNFAWDQRNGYTSRFLGFSIYVSNTTNKWDGTLCYKDNIFTKSTIPAVFNTTCFVHGQYVIYYNERLQGVTYPTDYSDYALNDLCEVEVYGCSTPGHYGINCSLCLDVNCRYCHIETGTCQRCKAGYKGDQCELECDGYMYGEDCSKSCGNCKNNKQCHHIDGTCMNGCENGYQGSKCDKECDDGTFGTGCYKTCGYCVNKTRCYHENGTCFKGCEPGYRGSRCHQECTNNKYGDECQTNCGHCVNMTQCYHVNGICLDGCDPGYEGQKCNQECTNNKYGDECQTDCGHCVNMTQCHHVNGSCLDGCDPGYEGQKCNQECQNRTYGYRCQRQCGHCLNRAQCDYVNGTCLQGCTAGFGGRTCNLVNLALHKPASAENIYSHYNVFAGKAVDGRKSNLHGIGGECSVSSMKQHTATWWVDLESVYSIHDIWIYYKTDNVAWGPSNGYTARFLGFSIYVSNTTDKSDGILCYKDTNFTTSTIPAVFTTTCFVHGQYVIYYNERKPGVSYSDGYSLYAFNDLCEVEVYGCPRPGYYSIDCNIPCPDVNCRYCHIETGTCQGCKPGYKGHQCELECDKGWYGDGCQRPCGHCIYNTPCDHVNGTCSQGCEGGYEGQTCDQDCQDGYFGENCDRECPANCKSCNKRSGVCDLGCHSGWKGTHCIEECNDNFYGANCNQPCGKCLNNEQCHNAYGHCENGCASGFKGIRCNTECQDGFFGENCIRKCFVTCYSCNKSSGICDLGCHPGWKGTYCTEECNDNFYGANCSQPCGKCLNNEQCHYMYGQCKNGCASGFKGNHCTTECQNGYFGENCMRECPITCYSCNKSSGICDLGCHPGWKGTYCTEECDGYTYGNNCQEHCGICRNGEECDTVTGVCSNGCDTGYTGDNCKETCSNNTYALLCSLTCGNCLDKQQCHHVTGKCSEGCAEGFQGEKCDKVKCVLPSTESPDHRSITYSVSALLALCVMVIIFLTFRLCKHERSYQCHQEKQPKDDRPVDNVTPTVRYQVNVEDDTAYQELNEVTYQPKRDDLGHTAVNTDIYVNVEGDNSAYQALGEVTQPSLYDTPFQN